MGVFETLTNIILVGFLIAGTFFVLHLFLRLFSGGCLSSQVAEIQRLINEAANLPYGETEIRIFEVKSCVSLLVNKYKEICVLGEEREVCIPKNGVKVVFLDKEEDEINTLQPGEYLLEISYYTLIFKES